MYELSKEKIFRGKREFSAVYNRGRSFANGKLVLYVMPSDDFEGRVAAVERSLSSDATRAQFRVCDHSRRSKGIGRCQVRYGDKSLSRSLRSSEDIAPALKIILPPFKVAALQTIGLMGRELK